MFGLSIFILLFLAFYGVYAAPNLLRRQSGGFTSPGWYPSPKGGTAASWASAYQRAHTLVSKMTLTEKVNITTGTGWEMGFCVGNTGPVPRLQFPSLCLQDGPLGIRFTDGITAFPAAITVAGTWDKVLMRARAEAMGAEFRAKGVHIALGPAMGPIGKHPAGGRNWEGFGSDPYLQGEAAYQSVLGIQSQGVIATAKHYVGNEQEHYRGAGPGAISSNIDDRTLHEIYLWPFQNSVKAGVGSVMCSYNQINDTAACGSSYLQNNVLKDELGFQGFIMSDWGAQMAGVGDVIAGMDMSMPGDGLLWDQRAPLLGSQLTRAVLNGSTPISRLDDAVTRIVAAWYKMGQDQGYPEVSFSSWTKNSTGFIYHGSRQPPTGVVNKHLNVMNGHPALARKIAAEGTALLKNDRETLPLKKPMKIGVYGEDARLDPGGPNVCPDRGCNQGTLAMGWGSGTADFEYLVEPLEAITKRATVYGGIVSSVTDNNKTDEIAQSAKQQDVCIAFVNADAGEGFITWDGNAGDRKDLNLQKNGDAVVLAVAENCENTIVVVHSVGPVIMEKWVHKHQVRSVVWAHLPGLESGNSLVDVLWGDINPSGKLPYTIGKSLEDYGPYAQILYQDNSGNPQQDMTHDLFIDYRHFDKNGIEPRYEFGYGLSYTTFKYGPITKTKVAPLTQFPAPRPGPEVQPPAYNSTIPKPTDALFPPGFVRVNRMIYPYLESANISTGPYPYPEGWNVTQTPSQAGGAEGGNPPLWDVLYKVSFDLTNTGEVAGAEAAQLYVEPPQDSGIEFPKRQLRGFEKVYLQPGETKTVMFELTRRDLSYWDVARQNWVVPKPGLGINVGASSRKIHGRGFIYTES